MIFMEDIYDLYSYRPIMDTLYISADYFFWRLCLILEGACISDYRDSYFVTAFDEPIFL